MSESKFNLRVMSKLKESLHANLHSNFHPLTISTSVGAGLICLSFIIYCFAVGFKLFVVGSGSMEPAISPGTVIITQPQDRYYPGEVITYQQMYVNPGGYSLRQQNITHRVVHTKPSPEGIIYKTKGDTNQQLDHDPVFHSQVLGKAIIAVPLLGFILLWPHSQLGFYFMILLPAMYIVVCQLVKIIKLIFNYVSPLAK